MGITVFKKSALDNNVNSAPYKYVLVLVYSVVWYCVVWYSVVWYGIVWYGIV